jgi:curli biogenesis system outer membrane secretion channel CsgG
MKTQLFKGQFVFFFAMTCFIVSATLGALTLGLSINQTQLERSEGPKASLSIGEFKDKTAGGSLDTICLQQFGIPWKAIGEGMRDMMTTTLFNTHRFLVVEREQLAEVIKEQDLGASGRVKKGTEPPVGEIQGADLMVSASVTEFDTGAKALKGGVDIAGIKIGGRVGKAHMAIDLRVIDLKTSQIVAATSIEGSASNLGFEGSKELSTDLPVTLGGFSKTPLEKALRDCIKKSVQYIVAKTPSEYFRYK